MYDRAWSRVLLIDKLKKISHLDSLATVPESRKDTLKWLVSIRGKIGVAFSTTLLLCLLIPGVSTQSIVYLIAICGSVVLTNSIYSHLLSGDPPDVCAGCSQYRGVF